MHHQASYKLDHNWLLDLSDVPQPLSSTIIRDNFLSFIKGLTNFIIEVARPALGVHPNSKNWKVCLKLAFMLRSHIHNYEWLASSYISSQSEKYFLTP